MPSASALKIDELIRSHVHPMLKSRGFRKKGRTWNRANGRIIQVINLQASAWNFPDDTRFTFNVGVYVPGTREPITGKPEPSFINELDCNFSLRISEIGPDGAILPHFRDDWFALTPATDPAEVGRTASRALSANALNFLDRFHDPLDVVDFMLSGPAKARRHHQAAIILAHEGNTQQAAELLHDIIASGHTDEFKEHFRGIAVRLGLPTLI